MIDAPPVEKIPIIELWGQLVVPLQGDVSDAQMRALEVAVLERVRERAPAGMVLDVSGVEMMDSHLCAVLSRLATAARLMGTRAVIAGMSPPMALTLEALDLDLGGVATATGLESALEDLGLEVRSHDDRTLDLREHDEITFDDREKMEEAR
jgi:rsbT antagonist protein RsbS